MGPNENSLAAFNLYQKSNFLSKDIHEAQVTLAGTSRYTHASDFAGMVALPWSLHIMKGKHTRV